jgi:DNA-binding transcriptional MocR family regulator
MYTEQITRLQLRKELDKWCEEYGLDAVSDDMYYPFSAHGSEKMSIIASFWRMYEEGRVQSMRGMRAYFDRQIVAAKNLQPVA